MRVHLLICKVHLYVRYGNSKTNGIKNINAVDSKFNRITKTFLTARKKLDVIITVAFILLPNYL